MSRIFLGLSIAVVAMSGAALAQVPAPVGGAPPVVIVDPTNGNAALGTSANPLNTTSSGGGGGAITAASGSYASGALSSGSVASGAFASGSISTGASPDIGTFGSVSPAGGGGAPSGTLNVINLLAGIYNGVTSATFFTNNSHVQSTALETSHVIKASAGTLFGYYCTDIAGSAAGNCIVVNATSAPATGTITGVVDSCYFATAAGCSLNRIPIGISASTGIVILISSAASPFTYTTGTLTGFISGDYR